MTRALFRRGDRVFRPNEAPVGTVVRDEVPQYPLEVRWDGLVHTEILWSGRVVSHRSGSLSGWAQLANAILWSALFLVCATVILTIAAALMGV